MKPGKNQSSKRNRNSSVTKAVVSAKLKEPTKTSDTKKQQTRISKCTKFDAKCGSDVSSTRDHGHMLCENQVPLEEV